MSIVCNKYINILFYAILSYVMRGTMLVKTSPCDYIYNIKTFDCTFLNRFL